MKESRKIRTYKISDRAYDAAKAKADKTKKPLATRIEEFVIKYGGVEKTPYFASMGDFLMNESNSKNKKV
jgi:xanthine dehydrogenase iron-sulfur cluster and FAD-binding subunit A